MYFHVYLIYRFTRTFTDHSSVITRCWGFELQNGKSSLKSPQTLAAQSFAPASFLSTHSKKEDTTRVVSSFFVLISKREICTSECGGARPHIFRKMRKECNKVTELCPVAGYNTDKESNQRDALHAQYLKRQHPQV